MRLVQFRTAAGDRRVGIVEGDRLREVDGFDTTLSLASAAIAAGRTMTDLAAASAGTVTHDYGAAEAEGRLLVPIDHPEPARFLVTGTGLTHIGSASARDAMHAAQHGEMADLTDSMKIFRMGLEGGKPASGVGVQPEWFYKGTGTGVVGPGEGIPLPAFALAGGEEAEIVGLYLVGPDGQPWRVGYCLGNEFSDHVTEAQNYLYLAHSKLRACSLGPELLLGALPDAVEGWSRIRRGGEVIWERPVLSGEANMSHSIANLEHYHFRYAAFRRPGDLHAYFFGAAVLSCTDGVKTRPGDVFEIDVPAFGRPLRNPMVAEADPGIVRVREL
jgi:hypothetical protein